MKKLTVLLLAFSLNFNVLAACDFAKDITKSADGNYIYPPQCHDVVGRLVKEQPIRDQEVSKLKEANNEKDLANKDLKNAVDLEKLAKAQEEARAEQWKTAAIGLEDRMIKLDNLSSARNNLYFIGGILTVIASGLLIKKVAN